MNGSVSADSLAISGTITAGAFVSNGSFNLADTGLVVTASGDVGLGTSPTQASFKVAGTVKMFGNWDNSKDSNTVYQATTDGFVFCYFDPSGAESNKFEGITDSSITPTTIRVIEFAEANGRWRSFTMAVKKGDYWKVNHAIGTTKNFYIIGN